MNWGFVLDVPYLHPTTDPLSSGKNGYFKIDGLKEIEIINSINTFHTFHTFANIFGCLWLAVWFSFGPLLLNKLPLLCRSLCKDPAATGR